MRRLWCLLFVVTIPLMAQQTPFRLHVQPGMEQMKGDGDESTTIAVTARDEEGNILRKNGTIRIQVNAGRLDSGEIPMRDGLAVVRFTAPILDNESKAFQRSIQLTFAVFQRLMGMNAAEVTGEGGKARMMKAIAETAVDAKSAAAMESVTGEDPVVRIIAEMGTVKGKATIQIEKVEGATPTSIAGGYYEGRDVMGQPWYMDIQGSGSGFEGIIKVSRDTIRVRCDGEKKGGFLVVYLLPDEGIDEEYLAGVKGMPTAAKIMPGNTIYFLAPPIYFSRKGDSRRETPGEYGVDDWVEEPTAKATLVARKNMLPGDGKSDTELAFIYRNKQGNPQAGVPVRLEMMRGGMGGTLTATSGTTDANGIFRCRYRAPEYKTDKFQQLGTCKKEIIYAHFREDKEDTYVTGQIGILRCTEAKLIVDKPGFEEKNGVPIIIASPRGRITGTITASVKRPYGMYDTSDVVLGHAPVKIVGGAIQGHESNFEGETDENGKLDMVLGYQNWPVDYTHELDAPFNYPFSQLHINRRKSLSEHLNKFSGDFKEKAGQQIYVMEISVAQDPLTSAEANEAKFHLLGDLMATYWMSEKLVGDSTGEVISHGWTLMGMVWEWADKKFKFGKKVKGMAREGSIADVGFKANDLANRSVRLMIFRRFNEIITRNQKSKWGKWAVVAMDNANAKIYGGLKQLLGFLADYLAKNTGMKFPENPGPALIKEKVLNHYRDETMPHMWEFLIANPEAVLAISEDVQPWLVKNSGDLRNYYQNVAWTRLVVEESKAWKDLVVDLTQGLAIGIAVTTGQVWALKYWKKLKDLSDMLDKAYAGSAFIGELVVCSTLMTETQELFIHTNKAIDAGGGAVTRAGPAFLPVAYAQETTGSGHQAPPSVFPLDRDELELVNGRIPERAYQLLMDSTVAFLQWEQQADGIWMLALDEGAVEDFVAAREAYGDAVEAVAVMGAVVGNDLMDPELQDQWDELLDELEDQGERVDKYASRAYQLGIERETAVKEETVTVNVRSRNGRTGRMTTRSSSPFPMKMVLVAGGGILLLLVLGGLVVVMIRRRPQQPARPAVQPVPPSPVAGVKRLVIPGGREIPLQGVAMEIGAESDNHIVLPYAGVLAYHASVRLADNGHWWVESRDVTKPIVVNGAEGMSFWLTHESRIVLGSAEIIYLEG